MLANRHPSWQGVFEAVEKFQGQAIENVNGKHDKFKEKLPDDSSVLKDPEIYAQQLLSYLSSYTKGNLHAKGMKTNDRNAFELLRDGVYKGKNRNKNRLLAFKASVFSPHRASNVSELQKSLMEWEHQLGVIKSMKIRM